MIALGLIVGLAKPRRLASWFFWAVFGPVLMSVGFSLLKQFYGGLSPLDKLAFAAFAVLAALVGAYRFLVPQEVGAHVAANLLYDTFMATVLLPLRVIRCCGSALIKQRNR